MKEELENVHKFGVRWKIGGISMKRFEKLFEPIRLADMELKNRIVYPPYAIRAAGPDGLVTKKHIEYYKARAKGGAGLVEVELGYTDDKEARVATMGLLGVYDDLCILGLAELAETIKMYGAKAAMQICHMGRVATPTDIGGLIPVGPSAIPDRGSVKLFGNYPVRALEFNDIERIIESFGEAARRIKKAGFDAVELHGAHGYLLNQFVSPYANKRTDLYGGDLEGRARFPLEVVERVREKIGLKFPLLYRMSADEFVPGGISLEDVKSFARMLEEKGVNCLHVSGSLYETCELQVSSMYIPHGHMVHLAEAIKKVVQIPVITVGGISDPEFAEKILEEGKADLVAMARALVADPDLPKKAAEGRLEDIIPCIRCNGCLEREELRWPHRCDVNFLTGRDGDYRITRAEKSKKVLIIGGGPAGMEAARVASLRGHEVILYEKNDKLGGLLFPASVPQFKQDIRRLIDYLPTQIKKLNVKTEFGKEVTPEIVKSIKPDVLIIATGFWPMIAKVSGEPKDIVATTIDVLLGKVKVGEKVLMVGGGYIGCEIAVFLAEQGKKVTVITNRKDLAEDIEYFSRKVLLQMLDKFDVESNTEARFDGISEKGAMIIDKECRRRTIYVDNVILDCRQCNATRQCVSCRRVRKNVTKPFKDLAPEVYAIGDCVEPRNIGAAIREGFLIAYEI